MIWASYRKASTSKIYEALLLDTRMLSQSS